MRQFTPDQDDHERAQTALLEFVERQQEIEIAKAFVVACASGDVKQFFAAVRFLNQTNQGWKLALRRLVRLRGVPQQIKNAFRDMWVTVRTPLSRIDDRHALAAGLRLLMPGYTGPPLLIFRGTVQTIGRRRVPGFSWTTALSAARTFARQNYLAALAAHPASELAIVVLHAIAPAETILLVNRSSDHAEDDEIVVDPFRLGAIGVVERRSPRQPTTD